MAKLVQLVLTSGTKTGNFGDIKHVLIGMLSNSAYETVLLETTSRILGKDLHTVLAKERRFARKGLCVKSVKCTVCRLKLYGAGKDSVLVFGNCGHALHKECASRFCTVSVDSPLLEAQSNTTEVKLRCPRCDQVITEKEPVKTVECRVDFGLVEQRRTEDPEVLKVSAPPRIGL